MNTTTENPLDKLDLRKSLVIDLKKGMGISTQKAQVVLALDYSGSMERLYNTGAVQKIVERILPLGLAFDDNGEVDAYLFHNSPIRIPKPVTMSNFQSYVSKYVTGGGYSMGGTDYAPIIRRIVEDMFPSAPVADQPSKGMFSRFFKKDTPTQGAPTANLIPEYPGFVLFFTDGETENKAGVEQAMREASKKGVFFQFIGIGRESFSFLKKLDVLSGMHVDNCSFFQADDIATLSDEQLYKQVLGEFPGWVPNAKRLGLIA